ncbi:uncharacterized protein HMPREF1541_10037 [Cyphellophora europaea CBS 101466]|uniref:Uncharacterized protein n=1 Tax=Cyphellophora europaea (strain CBS 101466) TaxID=1220924 RepID=W2S936_CYPE1|nr:uncharacterized protein HMPREF1541_10037 [Cyphellophora europaea CBS 101466]ETN45160.1 hypothetical protein HMPREF1541_10037 [Cyphellophora europaea CBS 101466]
MMVMVDLSPGLDPAERRSLGFYRERTTARLRSFKELSFWDGVVLQCSQAEESVRRMVIAIAALHEDVSTGERLVVHRPCVLALEEYSKAISRVIHYGNSMDTGTVLLTMVLFMFFESILGHPLSATNHLSAAVQVYSNLDLGKHSPLIGDTIRPILHRLRSTAVALDTPQFPGLYVVSPKTSIDRIHCLNDVDREIGILIGRISDLSRSLSILHAAAKQPFVEELEHHLKLWKAAYEQYLACETRECDCDVGHARLAALYLNTQSTIATIRIHSEPFCEGITLDQHHLSGLRHLVATCHRIIQDLDQRGPSILESFVECLGFELDLGPILSFVLMHCEVYSIRRSALDVLRIWCETYSCRADAILPDLDVLDDVMLMMHACGHNEAPTLHIPAAGIPDIGAV